MKKRTKHSLEVWRTNLKALLGRGLIVALCVMMVTLAFPKKSQAGLAEYALILAHIVITIFTIEESVPEGGSKTASTRLLNKAHADALAAEAAFVEGDKDQVLAHTSSLHGALDSTLSIAEARNFPAGVVSQLTDLCDTAWLLTADAIAAVAARDAPAQCGNEVCDPGENFCNCASDCTPDVVGCP